MKKFYRVSNLETQQGLWYDFEGNFTGLIHDKFNFCMNNKLPMPFNPEVVGWLSATDNLEDLFHWFSIKDIQRLEEFGYSIAEYEATDYKIHENHWLINQKTSVFVRNLSLACV
jgi:hypothetical protein